MKKHKDEEPKFSEVVSEDVANRRFDVIGRIIEGVNNHYGSGPYADPYVYMYQQIQDPEARVPEGAREMWWVYGLMDKAGESREAHDSLRKLAGYILHTGQDLPDSLRYWLEKCQAGNRPRPVKPGPDPTNNLIRDTGIRYAIWFQTQRGMDATRNPGNDPTSPVDAVAEYKNMKHGAVRKIWDKRKEAYIDVPSLMPNIRVPSFSNPFPSR